MESLETMILNIYIDVHVYHYLFTSINANEHENHSLQSNMFCEEAIYYPNFHREHDTLEK